MSHWTQNTPWGRALERAWDLQTGYTEPSLFKDQQGSAKEPEESRSQKLREPLWLSGPAPLFAAVILAKARTWCPRIWVLFWHSGHLHRETVSSGRSDSGAPTGTCRQKMLGFPGAARLTSGNTAVLPSPRTSSWLPTGPADSWEDRSQDPPRKRGLWALRPADLASLPEPPERVSKRLQPRAPLGRVPQRRGRSPLTPGPPGLRPQQTRFSWKTRCSRGRQASVEEGGYHQRWCQREDRV